MKKRELILLLVLATPCLIGWVGMQVYIANEREALRKITTDGFAATFTVATTQVPDDATMQAYLDLGATKGGWWTGDGGLHWGSPGDRLGGFKFAEFPKAKLPLVTVPFGLHLTEAEVASTDLRALSHQKNLMLIEMQESQITDQHLKALSDIGMLHTLKVFQEDHYWPRPKSPSDVRKAFLGETSATANGLRLLKPFSKLTTLHVTDAMITGATSSDFENFPQLLSIQISNSKLTDDDMKALRKKLPGLVLQR